MTTFAGSELPEGQLGEFVELSVTYDADAVESIDGGDGGAGKLRVLLMRAWLETGPVGCVGRGLSELKVSH